MTETCTVRSIHCWEGSHGTCPGNLYAVWGYADMRSDCACECHEATPKEKP